jgi:hypothetical protein
MIEGALNKLCTVAEKVQALFREKFAYRSIVLKKFLGASR